MRSYAMRLLIAGLMTVGSIAPLAASAASGGVRVIVQPWSPAAPAAGAPKVVLDKPGLLSDGLNLGWSKVRDPICTALKGELGKADRIAPGFTLYNMDCAMAKTGTLAVTGVVGSRVQFDYKLAGNMFKGTSTQPSAAGSYADPCFFLYYDLKASSTIHLDTLAVDKLVVGIENVHRPDSCNAAGDIAKGLANVAHFFGAPDFIAIAQDALTRSQDIATKDLNTAVASVMTPIRQYSAQYATQQSWVRHGDLFFAFSPKYVPQPLSAGIGGTIKLQKGVYTLNDCGVFSIVGNVQTGPPVIEDPERLDRLGSPPDTDVGAIQTGGAPRDAGDHYECAYTERQLPPGVPIAFRGTAVSRAMHRSGNVAPHVALKPDGWSGHDTLNGFASGKNFLATAALEVTTVDANKSYDVARIIHQGDPPDSRVTNVADQHSSSSALARIALNPQPLPPKSADPVVLNANAIYARGNFAAAAAAYQTVLTANASNAIALYNLGLAHARLGQTAAAKSELTRAAQVARSQGDTATASAADRAIIMVGGRQ